MAAFEWGWRTAAAALDLGLEVAGWPRAAEVGAKVRAGSPDRSKVHAAWAAEDQRLAAAGMKSGRKRAQEIADGGNVEMETVRKALQRIRKR